MRTTRKFVISTIAVIGLVVAGWSAEAGAGQPSRTGAGFVLPADAVEVAPGVFSLGRASDGTEGYAFVHRRHAAKPEGKGNGNGKGGKGGGGSTCYSFIASGARLAAVEPVVISSAPTGTGLSSADLQAAIDTSISEWESVTNDIFGTTSIGAVNGADTTSEDGVNEVEFGPIASSGTIAVTTVWGIFQGPPRNRYLAGWDMVFDNDGDWSWGDADVDAAAMDLLNIAVHEVGHAAGLGHAGDPSCVDETMYPYASAGETLKRTIGPGDTAGIQALYG